ncbi:translation elongation factor 4 [Patescibacteria group bacterium]|nr:translation elongation factor 4 [Patescibacteria group bacterium]
MDQSHIRNFCIIAHIDHGKSTLADRLLECTGTVDKRKMREQLLDTMDLERERGITIKLQPARMTYKTYQLNLIDTPGHVDFTYEVSRSLAAVEGALLLVDATQGVQAQTLGNLYLAVDQGLTIIPVVNKVDLPNAEVEKTIAEIVELIGCAPEEVIQASGKTGVGVPEILEAIVARIPSPSGKADATPRALIFDSKYDEFKGVVAYVRVVDGMFRLGDIGQMCATSVQGEVLEVGYFRPDSVSSDTLSAGEIGYIVTGQKDIENVRVGDTVVRPGSESLALPGYTEVKPMVFAGIFPKEGSNFERLRSAMFKLKLNDAALVFTPAHSGALGFGFQCGLLGLLHLEIVQERLRREYNMDLVVTIPSVAYHVGLTDGSVQTITAPSEFPDQSRVGTVEEPWVKADIVTPARFIGGIMALASQKRGIYKNTEYFGLRDAKGGGQESGGGNRDAATDTRRAILHFEIPLAAILVDFYDSLKSVSSGYASLNYEFFGYREGDIIRLEILVAEEPEEALFTLVPREAAYRVGRAMVEALKETVPRQQFEVKLQARIGAKVIASERIAPFRKDVLAKMSGGDWTRKMKLLEKQKKGKRRMAGTGHVDIPTDAYLAVLKKSV